MTDTQRLTDYPGWSKAVENCVGHEPEGLNIIIGDEQAKCIICGDTNVAFIKDSSAMYCAKHIPKASA
jgi:hypothetical protein